MEDFEIILLVKNWPISWPIKLYKGGEITLLESLEKEELINVIQKLEKENKELKEKIYGKIEEKEIPKEQKVISNEEKVKTFRDIFKGRTDLYAKRWTSNKTGKSDYSPVCRNEFSIYKCDKPRIKCNECPNRVLEPLTDEIILKHLKGEITIGIYPLLPGYTCFAERSRWKT